MRPGTRRDLSITLTTILLTGICVLGGSMMVTADTGLPSDQDPDCSFKVENIQTGIAPTGAASPAETINRTRFNHSSTHVAAGDSYVIKLPKADATECHMERFPGSNLGYANPSAPGTNTTHTISSQVNNSVEDVRSFSVKYRTFQSRPRLGSGLSNESINAVGIDSDRDGMIETSLKDNLSYVSVPDSKTIQFTFDGNVSVPNSSYFTLRYTDIQNPNFTDTVKIKTMIVGNRTSTDQGELIYGHNQSGLLGSRVNLSLSPTSRSESSLLSLRPYEIHHMNNSVALIIDSGRLYANKPAEYSYTIRNASRTEHTTETKPDSVRPMGLTVYDRYAFVFSDAKVNNDTLTLGGYTNVSPGSELSVRVSSDKGLRDIKTKVGRFQFWRVTLQLDVLQHSSTLEVNVKDINKDKLANTTIRLTP